MAILHPARVLGPKVVVVAAVAARDENRAKAFARRHGIPRVHGSYDELLADPHLDAIYLPLPNSHHRDLAIAALDAGKDVLCEKPLAANVDDATAMIAAATRNHRLLIEALHWRYHPIAIAALKAVDALRAAGPITRVRASFIVPFLKPGDIRYRLDLAGGALMDTGVYAVSMARSFAGLANDDQRDTNDNDNDNDEVEVVDVDHRRSSPGVDRWLRASLRAKRFPNTTIDVECGLCAGAIYACRVVVEGEAGSVDVWNPVVPRLPLMPGAKGALGLLTVPLGRLRVAGPRMRRLPTTTASNPHDGRSWAACLRSPPPSLGQQTSWTCQLAAFAEAVHRRKSDVDKGTSTTLPTDARDGRRNLAIIDAIYAAAGLPKRHSVSAT